VLPVLFGSLVATREQSLVGMTVDLNVVYITAVWPLLGLTLLNVHVARQNCKHGNHGGMQHRNDLLPDPLDWHRRNTGSNCVALRTATLAHRSLASRPRTNASFSECN
jgi:hypothetical protein